MTRRVFISYQHLDQMKVKGFNLLQWSKSVNVDFVGRHLLSPVDSDNKQYISSKIREQIKGTSVTVVLIGEETADSDWISDEVKWSLEKDPPNGILGIRISPDAPIPDALNECGAEIVDWDASKFTDAIERAAVAAKRVPLIKAAVGAGSGCSR